MKKFIDNNEYLLKEIRKGNPRAFNFLFDTYYSPLCNYINTLTKDFELTEDIVQETMLIIWKNRSNIKPQKSIKYYIYKIAYHQYVDYYRKNKKKLDYFNEVKKVALDYFIEKDDAFVNNKKIQVLSEIQKLSPKCREVFLLSKEHGMKYKEIAEELNISIKTVENQISKALKIIKNKFNEQ